MRKEEGGRTMIQTIKQNKKAVLALLLALVMVVGLVPFTATEVQAVEITPTAEGAEPFTKDFNLDLWSNENPDKYERHAMHYNGTSWNTLKTNKLYDNTFATAVAGKSTYVYSTNDGYNVNVSMDQMKGNLDAYDMMFASGQIEDASKPLDLHFEHLFVKLTFNIVYGSEYGDTPPTFYFVGIDSHGSLNDTVIISGVQEGNPTRTYSSNEGHTVSAAINYGDADDYTDDKIEVIVGDGTLPAGTEFLLLFRTYDDQNPLTVNVPEGGLTFVTGKHYEFDLKVGKDKVTLTPTTTDTDFPGGWNNEVTLDGGSATDTQDEGKTAWVDGDQIIATLTSQYYGEQTAMLTFSGSDGTWSTDESFSYLENETPTVKAVYAPSNILGTGEYIEFDCELNGAELTVKLESATRNYSRLRIVGLPNQTLTVTTMKFTPAGATEAGEHIYTLTTDNNGNAFLYGVFAEGATVSVKQGDVVLKEYAFTAEKLPGGTEQGKSYVLGAVPVIDGTLGGKTTATEDDINALVEQLKAYVDNGITTIIVTGSNPAMIDIVSWTNTAIGEAIYRLSGSDDYDENNPYNGKIDLILPDVTEIVDQEFYSAWALNSITLPKVIKIGDEAFHRTWFLKTITFESVLTEVNETGGVMFAQVGKEVEGCDLILNCGQMNESSVPAPDLTNNIWKFKFENEFKSITLTHTGECDECNAAE